MKNIGWFSRFQIQPHPAGILRAMGAMAAALLLVAPGSAPAQDTTPSLPTNASQMSIPSGFAAHSSVDAGGRINNTVGSGAMYNTLVNMQSGPRVLGQTFELHTLPGNKNNIVDDLTALSTGFGGDPYNLAKLDARKGNVYEFSGLFRRDRQYFDYNLLGNPGIPGGQTIPIGPSTAPVGHFVWPQITQSPFMFNTVRRMTDTNLTIRPLSAVTYRFGYSQNIFQGPSMTPSGNSVAGQEILLQMMQRNSIDDWTGSVEWKPVPQTRLMYEQEITHYKGDSYFNMAPSSFLFQEANGLPVAPLTTYSNTYPYGFSGTTGLFSPSSFCNATSLANANTILSPNPNGGAPIIDPACNVISSYLRSQPTREIFPTEIFRLQSSSIRNVTMNGNVRYTSANMNLPNYFEQFQGLQGANRSISFAGNANAKREVIATDYGITWQATKTFSLSEQFNFSNVHQPGSAEYTTGTTVTVPTTAGAETINNPNMTSCTTLSSTVFSPAGCKPSTSTPSGGATIGGGPVFDFFGQKFITNNITGTWDVTNRTSLSLTYRHESHDITEGAENTTSTLTGATFFTINQNGGIFSVATHPSNNWDLNASVDLLWADNVFTPVAPRQQQHYRFHTMYRPKTWATISGAYNDLERHNNTNNAGLAATAGPLDFVNHSRVASVTTDLMPNEHYGFDFTYAYSDVYTASNICFQSQATLVAGGAVAPAATTQTGGICPTQPVAAGHGTSQTILVGPARSFQDAPTQYATAALALSPVEKLHSNIGYRISSVNGSRYFDNATDVNGSMVSTYQSPFVDLAYALHKDFILKGEYNFYGYGEGGQSGAQYCNTATSLPTTATATPVVPCSTLPNTAMSPGTPAYGFTSPRNFHANNVLLGVHYEF